MSIKDFPLFRKATSNPKESPATLKQTPDDMRSRMMKIAERRRLSGNGLKIAA